MKKPVEAIERLRAEINSCVDIRRAMTLYSAHAAILAYLDSIPNDAHVCEWPKELTRERLMDLAGPKKPYPYAYQEALAALAAIAPKAPQKRMVEIWETGGGALTVMVLPINADKPTSWRKVAGPVEIDG